VPALVEALSASDGDRLFRSVLTDADCGNFGAVFVDLESGPLDSGMLTSLRKSPLGSSVPWVGLSLDPDRIAPVRLVCNLFVEIRSLDTASSLKELMSSVSSKILNGWESDLLMQEAKSNLQQKPCRYSYSSWRFGSGCAARTRIVKDQSVHAEALY
jgi:hypothetical protein